MPLIQSRLDSRSPQFAANREQMQALVANCGLRQITGARAHSAAA